jgi:putative sterol carrier protein
MSNAVVEKIIARMGAALGDNSGLGGSLKFDFGEAGSVLVDGKSIPNSVSDGADKSADCTIAISLENFERLVKKELDPTAAFMQGKLKVSGNMGLAMKLGPILSKAQG